MSKYESKKLGILFVCMGNICRSPAAHGTFQHLVNLKKLSHLFQIDSAGTHAYHVGEQPNSNAREAARKFGIELNHSSRMFHDNDFVQFDYILPMDEENMKIILGKAGSPAEKSKIIKFRSFDPASRGEIIPDVPDPYYGGMEGFDHVQLIMNRTTENLLEWLLSLEK